MIKDRIYSTYYNDLEQLVTIFTEAFEEFVVRESLYENWIEDMV